MKSLTSRIKARIKAKPGYKKMVLSCHAAENLGYARVWMDTCCIDKNSSAELQEAINSMWHIYSQSSICMAYLNDLSCTPFVVSGSTGVPTAPDELPRGIVRTTFERSQWFERGWTLQELIAPENVSFFSPDWLLIGTRHDLRNIVSLITGIPQQCLSTSQFRREWIRNHTVATKMSWTAKRRTTRVEDGAYSLLGLFNIQMPLLYGEGINAFRRLQEELYRVSDHVTLLLWRRLHGSQEAYDRRRVGFRWPMPGSGSFAASSAEFADVLIWSRPSLKFRQQPFAMTNMGLSVTMETTRPGSGSQAVLWLGLRRLGWHKIKTLRRTGSIIYRLGLMSDRERYWVGESGFSQTYILTECTAEIDDPDSDLEAWISRAKWNIHCALLVVIQARHYSGALLARRINPLMIASRRHVDHEKITREYLNVISH